MIKVALFTVGFVLMADAKLEIGGIWSTSQKVRVRNERKAESKTF